MRGIPSALTLFLAVWGAALSTFAVVRESWRRRRRGEVHVHYDFIPKAYPRRVGLTARISNIGVEPIFLERLELCSPSKSGGGQTEYVADETQPAELKPGQNHTTFIELTRIEQMIADTGRPLFAVQFIDQIGRRYSSRLMQLAHIEQTGVSGFSVTIPENRSWRGRIRRTVRKILSAVRSEAAAVSGSVRSVLKGTRLQNR